MERQHRLNNQQRSLFRGHPNMNGEPSPVHTGQTFTYTEFSAVHFENILRTESGHPLRLTYGGISIYDKIIPELYQKAMLWKDWKEASKGQRR